MAHHRPSPKLNTVIRSTIVAGLQAYGSAMVGITPSAASTLGSHSAVPRPVGKA